MVNKKIISLLLCASMFSAALMGGCTVTETYENGNSASAGSSSDESAASAASNSSDGLSLPDDGGFTTVEYKASSRSDKYRTYYEIFPYSFCDSDGDGIGDFKGITSKLDYLNDGDTKTTDDLGIEGIWLMPIMPSPSYHKYNVKNYKDVDPAYGKLDDFKEMLEEAHKRNINVIIDFVINHTSREHEWFQKAKEELKAGKTDGYAQYYHFEKGKENEKGWRKLGIDDWYYEGQFDDDMPDLNLKNEDLRKEIEDAAKFWLDMGVDGFRLDAVYWFEYPDNDGSVEDLKWFYDYVESVNKDAFVVGECWENSATIEKFYGSGVDSFFDFDEQGSTGRVNMAIHRSDAKKYVEGITAWQERISAVNPNAINTPFISNHDTGRSASFLIDDESRKMAAALYLLSPGNPFIYYGEEIAMEGGSTDPDKRKGMYWSSTDDTGYIKSIPGMTDKSIPEKGVDELEKDDNSLLNFYKRIIALRNQNPEIESGKVSSVTFGDEQKEAAGFIMESDGSKVFVLFNTAENAVKVSVSESDFKINEVRGYAIAGTKESTEASSATDDLFAVTTSKSDDKPEIEADNFIVDGQEVTMPARSVIVLK